MMLQKNSLVWLIKKFKSIKTSSTGELVSKIQYNSDKQNPEKKLKMLIGRYLILVGCLKRLITTQKLQKLKTKY